MKKLLAALAFSAIVVATRAQSPLHDYVTITLYGGQVIEVIPGSEPGVTNIELEKSEGSTVVRGIDAKHKKVISMVQEYEAKGWELFSVSISDPGMGMTWIMRKPKQ